MILTTFRRKRRKKYSKKKREKNENKIIGEKRKRKEGGSKKLIICGNKKKRRRITTPTQQQPEDMLVETTTTMTRTTTGSPNVNSIEIGTILYYNLMDTLFGNNNIETFETSSSSSTEVPKHEDEEEFIDNNNVGESELCKICLIRKKNVVVKDCGHYNFCITCIRRLMLDDNGHLKHNICCPLCRKQIKEGAIKVFSS